MPYFDVMTGNYRAASTAVGYNYYGNPNLIDDTPFHSWLTSFYIWQKLGDLYRGNSFCFADSTKAINGAQECGSPGGRQASRVSMLQDARRCLGLGAAGSCLTC
jgi:hypothetical protein